MFSYFFLNALHILRVVETKVILNTPPPPPPPS